MLRLHVTHRRAIVGSSQAPFSAPQSDNPESWSPFKGQRRFFLTLPSGFTPGGGVGTAFPLDPPLDRQGGTGPGAGARCRRPSEVKGGGRRDGGAKSRPHRCPRGILGANGLERGAPLWELQFRHNGQFYFPVFLNTLLAKTYNITKQTAYHVIRSKQSDS